MKLGPKQFRFSMSSLMLGVALIAVSIAWWMDHRRLSARVLELNSECGALFHVAAHTGGALLFPDGVVLPQRSYNFQNPEDRDAYREHYGHSMSQSRFGGRIWTRDEYRAGK